MAEGFEFYEQQEAGVGDYFLDCLYSDIDSLMIFAETHSVRFKEFYCLFSKRFPYAVYYTVEADLISVHAVLDCRQNPAGVESRLASESTRRWEIE